MAIWDPYVVPRKYVFEIVISDVITSWEWKDDLKLTSVEAGSCLQLPMEDVFVFHANVFTNWISIHDFDEPWRTRTKPLDVSFTPFLPLPL